jgi:hypothetical protein
VHKQRIADTKQSLLGRNEKESEMTNVFACSGSVALVRLCEGKKRKLKKNHLCAYLSQIKTLMSK